MALTELFIGILVTDFCQQRQLMYSTLCQHILHWKSLLLQKLETLRVKLSKIHPRKAKGMKDYVLLQEMACLG